MNCKLALEDGSIHEGLHFGARGTATGEVVFNTGMAGYQEIITDPSYCGQIVVMTAPMIGNYGVNPQDMESLRPALSGFVVKELARLHSNHRATQRLDTFLKDRNVIGLAGVDTRAITLSLRNQGFLRGALSTDLSDQELIRRALETPEMTGQNLAQQVAPDVPYDWSEAAGERFVEDGGRRRRIACIDCGIKHNILRLLVDHGCAPTVFGPDVPAERVRSGEFDGLFIGNGPGDPAAVTQTVDTLKQLVGQIPIFGICLGHQLLGLALGAKTYKLKFGHHGVNHPVLNRDTERIEITSQNHGFAVEPESLERVGGRVTHVSLNDGSVEGFAHREWPLFAVQYHPESAPGPHDSRYLFEQFMELVNKQQRNP